MDSPNGSCSAGLRKNGLIRVSVDLYFSSRRVASRISYRNMNHDMKRETPSINTDARQSSRGEAPRSLSMRTANLTTTVFIAHGLLSLILLELREVPIKLVVDVIETQLVLLRKLVVERELRRLLPLLSKNRVKKHLQHARLHKRRQLTLTSYQLGR